jgi:hypothetical protein
MAYPTIQFDFDLGADANLASGAGPAVAIAGTKARTRNYAEVKLGLYEASAPDLSGVEVDGSHAIKIGTASGRQWYKITGKKTTEQATTGTGAASQATITLASTAGMTAGDPIMITGGGAAAADLYTTISIVGAPLTLTNNLSTEVTDAVVVCPCSVTVHTGVNLNASDHAWAIGGQRGDPEEADQLWLDLLPGWTVDLAGAQDYELAATITLTIAGNTTDGRITIKSTGTATVSADSGAAPVFTLQTNYYTFKDLVVELATELVLINNANVLNTIIDGCTSAGDGDYLVRVTSAVTSGYLTVRDCSMQQAGVKVDGVLDMLRVDGSSHYDALGSNVAIAVSTSSPVCVEDCAFDTSLIGVDLGSGTAIVSPSLIQRCTFRNCVQDCVNAGNIARVYGIVVRNNRFEAQVYHLDFPAGADTVVSQADYNDHVGVVRLNNVSEGANDDVILTEDYRDGESFDYRIGLESRGTGYPATIAGTITTTAIDRGCSQRTEPNGGDITATITTAAADGDGNNSIGYHLTGGNDDGADRAVVVTDASVLSTGVHESEAVESQIRVQLREGATLASLIGQEILC